MVVKTERNVDDGVDLSFDSTPGLKKENFEMKVESNPGDVKVKFENNPPSHPPSQQKGPAGGRLKFFKEGRVLLELTHRCAGDGEKVNWVPTGSKKVYWPPGPPAPLTTRLDSNASTNTLTGSDGSGESGNYSSVPPLSPWGTPSPRPTSWQPSPPHRVKAVPKKWPTTTTTTSDLVFAMKPPQGVRNYRKKIRTFRRKCRQPGSDIKIGVFVLKMELQSAALRPTRRPHPPVSQAARSAKIEALLASIVTRKSMIHVPISAWRTGRTDLQNLVKNPPSNPGSPQPPRSPVRFHPVSPGHKFPGSPGQIKFPGSPVNKYPGSPSGLRVKSELKMITETCTSTITSISSPSRQHVTKVKAETRTVVAETRTIPVRSLPITPTVARVKSEPDGGRLKASAITALMSPEMARVRMEIGPAAGQHPHDRDHSFSAREQNFISPRKRYLREYENGGSPAKNRRISTEHRFSTEHRLSTDSLGSTGDRSSPYRGPSSPQPPRAALKPFSAFSIDSLISGSPAASPASPSRAAALGARRESGPFHPVPRNHSREGPGSPSRGHLPVAPTPTRPSPTPTRSPPPPAQHPGYPFMYPGHHPLLAQHPLFDPRLAHLAALSQAASMSQAAGYPFNMYPGFNPYLGVSSPYTPTPTAAPPTAAPVVWTPPVATPTPPNSNSSARETPTPTHTITAPTYPPLTTSLPPPTSMYAPTPALSAPRPVSAPRPMVQSQEKIQDAHRQPETTQYMETQNHDTNDAPLNLSMKPSSLKPTSL